MAPKRPSHLDDPPAASSDEEKEEASSDEEEDEDEDPSEEEPTLVRKTPTKKPAVKPHSSDSDDDSSSDSDEDDAPAPVAPVKPISSKAMDDSSAAASSKKPRSKASATPAKRAGGGEGEAASKASKRAKKKSGSAAVEEPKKAAAVAGDDEKKLFQRLWSEEDEIVILKGMIDFAAKTSTDPAADMANFLEFIKDSIQVEDFTKLQLSDKVRRLKKKYENNVKKNYVPSKTHEKKAYDLSKKIWFGKAKEEPKVNGTPMTASVRSAVVRGNGKTPFSSKAEVGTVGDMDSMLLHYFGRYDSSLPENVLKKGLDLVPEDKKAEFLDTWKKIEVAEADLFSRRSQAFGEQAKFIVDTFNSG